MTPKEKALKYLDGGLFHLGNQSKGLFGIKRIKKALDIVLKETKGEIEKKIFASDLDYYTKIKIKKIYDIEFER